MKKLLSILLLIVLLSQMVPLTAVAAAPVILSPQKLSSLRALSGTAPDAAAWHKGMAPTASMNAMQVESWLDWFLTEELGGVMNVARSYAELCEGGVLLAGSPTAAQTNALSELDDISKEIQAIDNEMSYHFDTLSHHRFVIHNELYNLQDHTYSESEKQICMKRALNAETLLTQSIQAVTGRYAQLMLDIDDCRDRLARIREYPDVAAALRRQSDALIAEADAIAARENGHAGGFGGAQFDVLVLSTEQFGFAVYDADKNVIPDVEIVVNSYKDPSVKRTIKTDVAGKAIFLIADFMPDENNEVSVGLSITPPAGYRKREALRTDIRGAEAQRIILEIDNGDPYLSLACFNGRDMLNEQNTIFVTPKNTAQHTFSVRVQGSASGKLSLVYTEKDEKGEEKEVLYPENPRSYSGGATVELINKWCRILPPKTTVTFRLETSEGFKKDYKTLLNVEKAIVDEPVFNNSNPISFASGLGFTIPKAIPFIGDSKLSLELPGCDAQFAIDPAGFIMFAYGKTFSSGDLSWQSDDLKTRERELDYKNKENAMEKAAAAAGVLKNEATTRKKAFLGSAKASFTLFAGLQGRIAAGQGRFGINGYGGFVAAFKGGYTQTFTIGPVPFFAGVDFGFSLGVGFALGFEADWFPGFLKNAKIAFGSGVTVSIMIEVGATIGVGIKDLASVSLRGYGYINPVLNLSSPTTAKVTLGVGFDVCVQILFLKWKKTIWKGAWDDTDFGANLPNLGGDVIQASLGDPVKPLRYLKLFDDIELLDKDVQYVALGDKVFAFWIEPDAEDGYARIVWSCLNNTSKKGVIKANINNADMRKERDDYAFAITSVQSTPSDALSRVAIAVLSGKFDTPATDPDMPKTPSQTNSSIIILHFKNYDPQTLELVVETQKSIYSESGSNYMMMPAIYLELLPIGGWYARHTCVNSANDRTYLGALLRSTQSSVVQTLLYPRYENAVVTESVNRISSAFPKPNKPEYPAYVAQDGTKKLLLRRGGETTPLAEGKIVFFNWRVADHVRMLEQVFYLENETLDTGVNCNRLKGIIIDANRRTELVTHRDYDVSVYADSFNITEMFGRTYLYWTESSHPDTSTSIQKPRYVIRCVAYDPDTDLMTAPFDLLELDLMPMSVHLLGMPGYGIGYYTVEVGEENLTNAEHMHVELWAFDFELRTAMEIKGAVSRDPCVSAGGYADLLFSVQNTGNLPVSRFEVEIKHGDDLVQTLDVDCKDPFDSLISDANGNRIAGWHAVRRVDGIYDDMNGDQWNILTQFEGGPVISDSVHADLLMPDGIHTYVAKMSIPKDWNGTKVLSAEAKTAYALADWRDALTGTNTLMNSAGVAETVALSHNPSTNEVAYALSGGATPPAPAAGQPFAAKAVNKAMSGIALNHNDLMMDYRLTVVGGVETVRLNIVNRAASNANQNSAPHTPATVTFSVDGRELKRHTFALPISAAFGYTVDIPLDAITGGKPYNTLTATVGGGSSYNELSDYDNSRVIILGKGLYFTQQPQDVIAQEKSDAVFSVAVAGGSKPYSYEWQQQTPNGSWISIGGATSDTLTIKSVTMAQSGMLLRCVVSDQTAVPHISASAKLTVIQTAPLTGDDANAALWALLMLAALAGIAAILLMRRRSGKRAA